MDFFFRLVQGFFIETNQGIHTMDNPTLIGVVNGISFYENPELGDEAPLMVKYQGEWRDSCFWDLPGWEEVTKDELHKIID